VEVDDAGNVYIAVGGNNAIRMLSGAWIAGTGTAGSQNDAVGTSATLNSPFAVRANMADGLLYVADTGNYLVRIVNIAGSHAVATLVLLPHNVYDIALDALARIMYVAVRNSVYIVTYAGVATLLAGQPSTTGYIDGAGSAARFNEIIGLVRDARMGVLYGTDINNNRVRQVTIDGGVTTTLAGSGATALTDGIGTAAAFYYPYGIALDAASGALYIGDDYNHAIRRVQLPPPALAPVTLAAMPLPPSPLAPTHQLTAWRALGTSTNFGSATAQPALDALAATFLSPLSAANTACLNPAIGSLLLGAVTLSPRNATPAAAGNTNTTFSTSAQRGLRSLTLTTPAVPAAALALPAIINLTLAAPAPTQQLHLIGGSFDGLATLICINCGGVVGLANLSGLLFGDLLTQPLTLPLITALDASATGFVAVYANSFDGIPALRWLSLAGSNLSYVSDAAFSGGKQPALAVLDQSRTPLTSGSGCRPGSTSRIQLTPAGGTMYIACSDCPAGMSCNGGSSFPAQCGANTFAVGFAAACAPCPTGTYAMGAAKECVACPPGLAAPACNASASWRDTITLVADGAGSWVNACIYLVPAGQQPATANVSCGPVMVVSTTTLSCALPFLLPGASTAPVLTQVWVAHAGTSGISQRLNASVMLVSPPPLVLAPGGNDRLLPLTASGGRIVLRLPAPRLTAADWTVAGLPPPPQATIDKVEVWLANAPCTEPAWESSTSLSCAIPSTDGVDIPVVVLLAGLFNVSGVLPSVFTPPALAVEPADVALLPPANSGNSTINITLPGTALCVGQRPRLTAAYVGGLRCGAVGCIAGRSDAALCMGWNATAAAGTGLLQYYRPTVLLNASAVWANRAASLVACDACVSLATRPVLTSITPTSIAAPGLPVVVTGSGMMDATRAPPIVLIGGEECSGVTVLSQTVVQCNAPTVQPSAPGYPVVSVVVVNAAGAASTEHINLTYPATFAVSWASTPTLTTLPGGLLSPSPTLRVLSRQAVTCSLAINVSSCATTNPALSSRPAGMTVSSAMLLSVGASGTADAVYTDLHLDVLEASGASGCTGTLAASCVDAVGLTASTAGQVGPMVVLASWHADWNASDLPPAPFVVVPVALPRVTAVFSLVGSDGVLTATSVASLSCLALLLPAAVTSPPLSQSLDRVSPRDVLSSVSGSVTLLNGSAAGNAFTSLSASAAHLGQALALYAECTWVPTGERLRLPTLPLAVANVSVALIPATVLLVEAYESTGIAAAATLTPPGVGNFAGADARCTWRAIAATSSSIVLAASSSAGSWTLDANGAVVGSQPLALTVEGPPGATLTLQLVCSLWGGNSVASLPLNVATRAYTVALRDGASGSAVAQTVWPSGALVVLPWAPPLDVMAPARNVLTCSVAVASVVLPPATTPAPGVGLGLSDAAAQLVGEASVSVSLDAAATRANVALPHVGLRAPGGTNVSLVLTCRDGVGRSAVLGEPVNVSVAALAASWIDATVAAMPSVVVPSQPLPALTLTVASTPAVPLPPDLDAASLLSCVAGIFRASTPLPLAMPLATLVASASPFASVSSSISGATTSTGADNASIVVTLPPLPTANCPLATQLTVAAECSWTPTGERVRLPALTTSTLQLTLSWAAPPAIMLAYTPLPLDLTATIGARATSSSGAATTAACEVLLVNATIRSTRLVADTWSLAVDGSAAGGTSIPTFVNVTLQAPPATQVYVQVACTVWGQVLTTPPWRVTTASLEARITTALPSTFIASDASSPWPLEPPLVVAVVTRHDDAVVADVTCSVTVSTPVTELVVVDTTLTSSLRSIQADEHTGTVAVPRFVVQTSPATRNVTLVVECQHLASGDAVTPLSVTIPATLLTVEQCVLPATKAAVDDPLPSFSVGIAVTPPGGATTSPCTATTSPTQLPSIVCTIALNASASTINDTSSVFLQHTAVVPAENHVATFDALTLVVPQGQTYGLTLTCAVGGLAIPPTLAFAVEVHGCRAGQVSESVTCVTCGGGTFSLGGMGARCIGCPPAGATCVEGILSLLPHYFRPAVQAGVPLGPDTELHPCYNSEACTLEYSGNASGADYACSYGYTGPLCGVCDADVNYARFGAACAICWDAGVSWMVLSAVVAVVMAVLIRVALRTKTSRSDASIMLRITLGYAQAVGSLRVFRAGSTKAYENVMGWTEVVSASPLSVGALQCIVRLPYLFQYVTTILLPVLASAAVVVIFLGVTASRAVHCKPRCNVDRLAFKAAVAAWWASKRHLATLLFVLFLAYMPIVSASLRALDCIDPVGGVRYLRSDLSVECGVGQHAAALVLAYTVLIVLGAGFPAGLAWLLGTARNDQLVDPAFHATWGFLFDGYRAPTRKLSTPLAQPATPGALISGGSDTGTGNRHHTSLVLPGALAHAWVVSGDSRLWWEAIVLGRKAGVVLLAVLVTNPYLQCVGATLWFLGALLLQLRYTPYTKPLFNRLEVVSLVATLLTAVISTALLQYNVGVTTSQLHPPDAMTGIEWTVTILLAVLNVGTFVLLAGYWLRLQCARAHHIVRRASMRVASPRSGSSTGSNSSPGKPARGDGKGTPVVPEEAFMVNPLRAGAGAGTGVGTRRDVTGTGTGTGTGMTGRDPSMLAPAALKIGARAPTGGLAVAKTRREFGPAPAVGTATSGTRLSAVSKAATPTEGLSRRL